MNNKPWIANYDEGVPETLEYPPITLPELLDRTASKFPGNPAIYYYGSKMTYRELNEKVNQFTNLLIREGIQRGDRIALYLPNCPACVIAFFGTLRAGAILTQLNPLYSANETVHQLKDSGAQYVVSLDRFASILKQVAGECGLKKVWITRINDYFPIPLKWFYPVSAKIGKFWVPWPSEPLFHSFVSELSTMPKDPAQIPLLMDETALLQYTGGTTGLPKGVILTHRNLMANAYQCKHWFPGLAEGKECFMVVVPIFHCYGMTAGMNFAVALGASMVLMAKFEVLKVMKAIDKYHVSIFPGIQAIYVAINNHPKVGQYNIRSIKACISGAGPLHQEVQRKFEELTGGKLVEGYGLTEASPVTHCNPVFGKRKRGMIGFPLVGTEAKIMDAETGKMELKTGETGEIIVKGPQVMKGYWNQPEETAMALKDGWLYTGDIGYMDEDGFFAVVDRKKDMIKVGGENVYPRDVEEVLFENEKIQDCVVAGVPDETMGEKVKAYIVLKKGCAATSEEITGFCKGRMAKYKVPKKVEFRESLPKNAVGKMLRRILLEEEKTKPDKS